MERPAEGSSELCLELSGRSAPRVFQGVTQSTDSNKQPWKEHHMLFIEVCFMFVPSGCLHTVLIAFTYEDKTGSEKGRELPRSQRLECGRTEL